MVHGSPFGSSYISYLVVDLSSGLDSVGLVGPVRSRGGNNMPGFPCRHAGSSQSFWEPSLPKWLGKIG